MDEEKQGITALMLKILHWIWIGIKIVFFFIPIPDLDSKYSPKVQISGETEKRINVILIICFCFVLFRLSYGPTINPLVTIAISLIPVVAVAILHFVLRVQLNRALGIVVFAMFMLVVLLILFYIIVLSMYFSGYI